MLAVKDVFTMNEPGNVSVKELSTAPISSLLLHTNDLTSRAGFKDVWTRSGRICVRKSFIYPIISIRTAADLFTRMTR